MGASKFFSFKTQITNVLQLKCHISLFPIILHIHMMTSCAFKHNLYLLRAQLTKIYSLLNQFV